MVCPLTLTLLLKVTRGEVQIEFVRLLLHIDHTEVWLKPHPLLGLIPLPHKFPETDSVSRNVPPAFKGEHDEGTGAPVPHVFVDRPWNCSATE